MLTAIIRHYAAACRIRSTTISIDRRWGHVPTILRSNVRNNAWKRIRHLSDRKCIAGRSMVIMNMPISIQQPVESGIRSTAMLDSGP